MQRGSRREDPVIHEQARPPLIAHCSASTCEHDATKERARAEHLRTSSAKQQADIVQRFRDDAGTKQVTGARDTPLGKTLYMARPTRADPGCPGCRSLPSLAPATLLARYGRDNGFGWQPDEIVGAQIVSVPFASAEANARRVRDRLLTAIAAIVRLPAAGDQRLPLCAGDSPGPPHRAHRRPGQPGRRLATRVSGWRRARSRRAVGGLQPHAQEAGQGLAHARRLSHGARCFRQLFAARSQLRMCPARAAASAYGSSPGDVAPAADWAAEIIDAIYSARLMLLVISDASNESAQRSTRCRRCLA